MRDSDLDNKAQVVATLVVEEAETAGSESSDGRKVEDITTVRREERRVVELCEGETFRVGRAKQNELALRSPNVSRFHAVFSASASGVVLSDLSSLNGTLVNGARISNPVGISSGDVVTIGGIRITVQVGVGNPKEDDSLLGRTQSARLEAVMVTVLIADVCGYTKLSETLPAEDVASMLSVWFEQTSEIVRRFGGEVDKYIGDCVMALWKGSADDAETFTKKAVEAGLEILQSTAALSTAGQWKHHEEYPWSCRVALNTGEALLGGLGGAGKRDFTVLGDSVNVAFRLEGIAGELGTNFIFSSATAELIRESMAIKELGTVSVHGRTGEVQVYTVPETGVNSPKPSVEEWTQMLMARPIVAEILARLEAELSNEYSFHCAAHTRDVFHEAVLFGLHEQLSERDLELLAVSAAYHDAGFLEQEESNEEIGARMAEEAMKRFGGYTKEEIELVKKMILDTQLVDTPSGLSQRATTELSKYLLDADLSNFGREDFFERLNLLCKERHVDRFDELRRTVVLMNNHQWCSQAARELRSEKKQENLKTLKALLGE